MIAVQWDWIFGQWRTQRDEATWGTNEVELVKLTKANWDLEMNVDGIDDIYAMNGLCTKIALGFKAVSE